ncbi:AAA family ATPase [Nocardioides jiangxiensis]|uniref:AAA family ATPase n=1 Tax=Nocardioides jiangxiensis TaxID=3064524 RepID=A0ABT9B0A9_9ACTN|nr:TniB family NTP-binding protein [Nocardioides sp. WY-20]MDO7868162.1 AAA family ATPase [Nocardioides sp. WY-20]
MFERLDDWPSIHQFRNQSPPTNEDDLFSWIHMVHIPGPFEQTISDGFDRLIRHHRATNQRWLAVSGASHMGKTQAVTNILIERAMQKPEQWRTRSGEGVLSTPYVYVVAASNQEARGLLATISKACGLPDAGTEQELKQRLAEMLPRLGTRLVVVDDAHMFRRRNDAASRVTDGLRKILEIPVPFAFVGVDLHSSALLYRSSRNNDTAHQLERRHFPISLEPLDRRRDVVAAAELAHNFRKRMAAVTGLDIADALRDAEALAVVLHRSQGRPGSFLNVLKQAVIEAIAENDGVLTAGRLVAEAHRAPLGPLMEGD